MPSCISGGWWGGGGVLFILQKAFLQVILQNEMNFYKCLNDPRSRAASVSQDKLVPGEDSDKVCFKIKSVYHVQEAGPGMKLLPWGSAKFG